ncbi:MAG: exodeoxyribonuclease V subunit gamma, partial [Actinobacteria bacterium]|nr:exodeoxyribonuclease V subunit gamma [Actinomycetota bacterium]
DDVLQRDPCLGERDPRSEDRQLLLDAVMAAGDHLLLLYTGADPVTGASRPPAVPLGELLDVVRATVGGKDIVTRHPLQPFDARNFHGDAPFSFDAGALEGARAAARDRTPAPAFLAGPLAGRTGDVALADLIAFLEHPTRAFLKSRLGIRVPDREESVADELRAELDGLQKWDVGDRMLAARLVGVGTADFRQAEWRRGTLPPGPLAPRLLAELEAAVEQLAEAALPVHDGMPATVDVAVDLGGGRLLSGTVGDIYSGIGGSVLASTSYSTLAPKHRLPAWAKLLAVAASGNPGPIRAVTTGRGPYSRPVWRSTIELPASPRQVLRDLVALYDEGMREPLPIATGASHTYAARRDQKGSVAESLEAARKDWASMFGDGTDRHLGYVLGAPPSFERLVAAPDGGVERTRFGALARRLWAPLLAVESIGPP